MSTMIPLAPTVGRTRTKWRWRLRLATGLVPPRASQGTLQTLARAARVAFFCAVWFLTAGVAGLGLYGYVHAERIYEGVTVGSVRVGGMTETDARRALVADYERFAETPLRLTAGGQTFAVTPRELGISLDAAASADAAFGYGRSGSLWDRSITWTEGLLHGGSIPATLNVNQTRLDAYLTGIAPEIVLAPTDATVRLVAGEAPMVTPDAAGIALDLTTSGVHIVDRVARFGSEPVALATVSVPPTITAAALAPGLTEARNAVGAALTLSAGERSWTVSPDDLKRIIQVGGADAPLTVKTEPLTGLVQTIAGELDQPGQDAGIGVDETGTLIVQPGTKSTVVDVETSVATIVETLLAGRHEAAVAIVTRPPAITDDQAAVGVTQAEALIADGLDLTWQDGSGRLERADLLAALTIEPRPGEAKAFAFDFDRNTLTEQLGAIAAEFDIPAKDATFRLGNGGVTLVSESQEGRSLDVAAGVETVARRLLGGGGDDDDGSQAPLNLMVKTIKPEYTAADRAKIKVPDLLADSLTYYGYSSEPRRQNVERAVELEGGWLVPPGGVFSYVEHIGRVDEAGGFATGFGIVADEERGGVTTAPVIGGGICQVSTTIFQAAFWAGMPVVERWQHPYWLTGYGNAPRGMKGLDAMVNVEDDWALDMKFENATDNWIAVVVIADGENVIAQIWGTDPGWDVSIQEPVLSNIVPLDNTMYYTTSPELPKGEEMQVETAQEGFDTAITRTVTANGEVILQDTLESSFKPARNTILRGTGPAEG